ncbi:MAG: DNA gyrase subunit A [Glaciecola sp.]
MSEQPPIDGPDDESGSDPDAPQPSGADVNVNADPSSADGGGTEDLAAPGPIALRVEPVVIEDEMKSSYLDYAMSVIVGRALPDVRDGLKPVHRRILYSMDEGGLRPSSPYRKCASAVGDVMKKYHPHGDSSIYDALVRMGQDFSIRAPLVDGHGNFGSVDGDPAAAMRYTEARLSKLAMELLRDIDEETVDYRPNYDGYEQEPVVLPARFPNLLVNGATGIAVGMATNIPPHNLGEVIDATIAKINDPTLDSVALMEYIPGPDFPTGAQILGQAGIHAAYTTGRGSVKVRGVCEIEEVKGRERIVITEIPYMVNKARMVEKIAELVRNKVITGISDLRDESSREGMRVVVEIKRDASGQVVLNQLFKHTQLQDTFGCNMLALVDGIPRTLPLAKFLEHYIDHQIEVIRRRTEYRLKKAKARAHVLEGLLIALDHIDAIITLIRNSPSADEAKSSLMSAYTLSEIQAQAILDMQLRRLAALERQRIQDEYDELAVRIADLEDILATPSRIRTIIIDEMSEIREKFADARRTSIAPYDGDIDIEDLIPQHDVAITLTMGGYLKRTKLDTFKSQNRGGRGVRGAAMKDDDVLTTLKTCSSHDHLLFFTNQGRVYRIKAYQVPERDRSAKGIYVANVPGLALEPEETIAAVLALKELTDDWFLIFATKSGQVKRTHLSAYDSPRSVLIAISLREGDELLGVQATRGDDDIMLVSSDAKSIRFHESDARSMGRDTAGVRGMTLNDDAKVVSMAVIEGDTDHYLMTVAENGKGKRTTIVEYPVQKRGGRGVITMKLTPEHGSLVRARVVNIDDEVLLLTNGGVIIRTSVLDVSQQGRSTQGVNVMRVDAGTKVVDLNVVVDNELVADEAVVDGDAAVSSASPSTFAADASATTGSSAPEVTDDANTDEA